MGEVLKKSRSAPDAAQTNLGKNLIKIGYIIFLYQMENSTNFENENVSKPSDNMIL